MKSSSLAWVRHAGVPSPRAYRDSLIHDWYLTAEQRKHLTTFFQAKASFQLIEALTSEGELILHGKKYSITWLHSLASIKRSQTQIAFLSFRFCPLLERGYVLIKRFEGEDKAEELIP